MLEDSTLKAANVMSAPVITLRPHTSLRQAARLMATHKVSGLPVTDDDGRLVGILSEGDLLNWTDKPSEKQAWWLNMLADGFDLAPTFLDVVRSEREKVRTLMSTDVISVEEATPIHSVARLLAVNSIKRVPVVRGGMLVGIITRSDLVRVLARG